MNAETIVLRQTVPSARQETGRDSHGARLLNERPISRDSPTLFDTPILEMPTMVRDVESCASRSQGRDDAESQCIQSSQQLTSLSSSAVTTAAAMTECPWDYSIPVPGSKKRKLIFPKAAVEMEPWTPDQWEQRFVTVKNQLETLVHRHLRLLDFASRPTYSSRMVGTCSSDARPSVVVICRDIDFKNIQHLFRTRAQERLHLGKKKEAAISLFFSLRSREGGQQSAPTVPRLQLVYYQTPTPPVAWSVLEDPLHVYLGDNGTACGGIVRYRDNMATLGVAVDFLGEPAFLTVGHLFDHDRPGNEPSLSRKNEETFSAEVLKPQTPTDPSYESPDSPLWDDDDEYEALDMNDEPEPIDAGLLGETTTKGNRREPEQWEAVSYLDDLDLSCPYLDWDLVRPLSRSTNSSPSLINTVFPDGNRVVLTEYQRYPLGHLAAIYMVSGLRGIVYGQIVAGLTFLPSLPGQPSGAAWTVILDSKEGR